MSRKIAKLLFTIRNFFFSENIRPLYLYASICSRWKPYISPFSEIHRLIRRRGAIVFAATLAFKFQNISNGKANFPLIFRADVFRLRVLFFFPRREIRSKYNDIRSTGSARKLRFFFGSRRTITGVSNSGIRERIKKSSRSFSFVCLSARVFFRTGSNCHVYARRETRENEE